MNVQDITPEFVQMPAFRMVGIERYTENGIEAIRDAWSVFGKRMSEVQHKTTPEVCYGFEDYSRDLVMTPGEFPKYYYTAGVQVDELTDIPEGMVGREVPAADYARFTLRGSLSQLPDLFRYIYQEWMPTSGYVMDPKVSADFERYPEPFDDMEQALVEVHVPLIRK